MEPLNIFLFLIIAYVIWVVSQNNTTVEKATNVTQHKKRQRKKKTTKENFFGAKNTRFDDRYVVDDVVSDIVSWDSSYDFNTIQQEQLNPNFINNQFHNSYRGVIAALNNLVPDKKQIFNLPNIPLTYSEPETAEVKYMIKDFMGALNHNLDTEVPHFRHVNTGWDEPIQDPQMESGWDKTQKALGLPTSLFEDAERKAPVHLVKINYVQKYETEDEIKYVIELIVRMAGVEDQMILKASFVQDKRPLHDENLFFNTSTVEMKITIEDLFIVGYLSKVGDDAGRQFDGNDKLYYGFDGMEVNNMTDPKYIQRVLMSKYADRQQEVESRNAMLDEDCLLYTSDAADEN